MSTKRLMFLFVALVCSSLVFAQEGDVPVETSEEVQEDFNDTWKTARVTDEMTVDADQNKEWRMGQQKYSAKPKDALEVGITLGHFMIDGDVDREIPAGWGVGLHLRKAFHYIFSVRASLFYGQAKGLDPQFSYKNLEPENYHDGIFNGYGSQTGEAWFFAHQTTYANATLEVVINIGNLLFHKERNKWNWYAAMGAGLDTHRTMLDLRDGNGELYTNLINRVDYDTNGVDTKAGRDAIKSNLKEIYDGTYETEGPKKKAIFRFGDSFNVHFVWTASMGISRKISKRINVGLEHKLFLSDNDFLDGQKYRTHLDQTNNVDIGHYTNLIIGVNIGNFDKRTEPLYWLNPLDATFNDIAELKKRPQLDLTDDDEDGVIDMVDQELDTPAGCVVDTRGITLDSDGDGIADCKDQEPYSPPGLAIDENGVAEAAECCITDEQVQEMIDAKMTDVKTEVATAIGATTNSEGEIVRTTSSTSNGGGYTNASGSYVVSGCGNWFLPMIHFDNNQSKIKSQYYTQMHHIGQVMKKCPELCVVAYGHTDNKNSNEYNNVLSYNRAKNSIDYLTENYGIDRSRLKLMYGGEESPIGGASGDHYLNRRVEFRTCEANDFDMAEPEGYSTKTGSSESGSNYSNGNKNSGY